MSAAEKLLLSKLHPFTYETAQEDGYYAVYFKNTCNTLGNIVFPDEIFSDFFDYALMLEPESDTVKLLYKPADGLGYICTVRLIPSSDMERL